MAKERKLLDRNTYGAEPCAVYLAIRLNELGDQKLIRKVSRFLSSNNITIRAIADIEHTQSRNKLGWLFKNYIQQATKEIFPDHIASVVANVAVTKLKIEVFRHDEEPQEDFDEDDDMPEWAQVIFKPFGS